jgi:hypothetical protein
MKARAGRPTDGVNALAASAALLLVQRGHSSAQAIATADEVCKARYQNWPESVETESVKRTMRRIANGERQRVQFPVDFVAALLAASDSRSEALSDTAASLLSEQRISVRESRKATQQALSELQASRKIKQ